MSVATNTEFARAFARHETFHPRYGWLKKGFDQAGEDPSVFAAEDATTRLGVGKNMVNAIRYWCLAYKVLEDQKNAENSRALDAVPTDFGRRLLSDHGWDPYLEDPGSLWLLHWKLLSSPTRAPSWWAVFNESGSVEFSEASLLEDLKRFRDANPDWLEIADGSLEKDARCLLRMYGSVTQGRDLPEDSVDSPFSELDLFRPVAGSKRHWLLNVGAKRHLPDDLVVYACLDFASSERSDTRLIGLANLTLGAGSPGRAFALNETAIADAVSRHGERHSSSVQLTNSAGNLQLVIPDDSKREAEKILASYYKRNGAA